MMVKTHDVKDGKRENRKKWTSLGVCDILGENMMWCDGFGGKMATDGGKYPFNETQSLVDEIGENT